MSPSVKQVKGNMAYRGNRNRGNFGGGYNNGPMGGGGGNRMNMSPWETQNAGGVGNYSGGGYMRQGGGGGGGQNMNVNALNVANNLLREMLRNHPPSLLDLPRGSNMDGNRNRGGPMVNRSGGGGGGNRSNNRRSHGGFHNRGAVGAKPAPPKQGNGGGIRKQNAIDRARKLLSKNANNKKKDAASPGEKKTESKDTIYANIHNDMFYCHLCKKHMWDAISFENHIKGRTHLMMREGIEESYRLKANMIRQEAKIAEQLKAIELDRLKNMGKNKHRNLDYCTMCDLNFHGHITTHRKSEGHLQLKKFLHPKCAECNKEFPTRIDYDTHLLSPDHLRIASEKNIKVGETKRPTLQINTEEDELKDIRPPQKKRKRTQKKEDAGAGTANEENGEEGAEVKQEESADAAVKTEHDDEEQANDTAAEEGSAANETKEEGGDALNESAAQAEDGTAADAAEEEEEVPLPVDPEDCILDFTEGDDIPIEIESRLPKYNWTRPVGTTLISKLECFECSLCGKYFDTEKTVEVHSRTVTHYRNFLKFINEKSSFAKFAQKRAAAALEEENARKKMKMEEEEKAEENGDDEEGSAGGDEEAAENGDGNGELYDPSEATGEDEDVEMAENGEDAGNGEQQQNAEEVEQKEDVKVVKEEEAKPAAEPEPEPKPEPEPETKPAAVVVAQQPTTPKKPETPKVEPVKTTPVKQAAAPAADESPSKKPTPAARTPAARNTPRGRGRGRYTRY